jgi:peptide/nickel transport system ATP-binding protein
MADVVLDIQGLSLRYATANGPVTALDEVSLAIPHGGAMGLVGESGSGKSSMLLAMLGLLGKGAAVTADAARFDGQDLLKVAASLRGRRIGTVFQDPSAALNPALTIGMQVAEPLTLHRGMNWREAMERAEGLLAETGIHDPASVLKAYPHQLSGGMKQRAVIAQALGCEPDLLLLDEPTTALDVTVEAQILDLLDALRARRGISLLLVSHNLGIVDRICDDLTVLYAGRVVEQGPCAQVLAGPRHPYARGLMAAMPIISHGKQRLTSIEGNLPDLTLVDPGCNFAPRCPFAVPSCAEPQALAGEGDHRARCHRAAETAALPWPEQKNEAPASMVALPERKPLLEARGMSRRFAGHGGLWRSLDWRGGWPKLTPRKSVVAVDDVTIEVRSGEVLGLVGESGSGKSTLGRLLLRLVPADAGQLEFGGTEVPLRPSSAFCQQAQIIFQNPDSALNPHHTVLEILKRPLELFGIAKGAAAGAEIDRLLDLVRLPRSYRSRYPHQMSGGEKQRIGIARALAGRPRFVVCDEAVSALDVSVQAAVLNLLSDLRAQFGLSYLFISHDIGVIAHISDRIAVMYRGAIVQQGEAAQLLRGPHHPYTASLLSAVPVVGAARSKAGNRIRLAENAMAAPGESGCSFASRCPQQLGSLCRTQVPAQRRLSNGVMMACHLPDAQLETVALGLS